MAQQRDSGKFGDSLEKAVRGQIARHGKGNSHAFNYSSAAGELGIGAKRIGRTYYVCVDTWPAGKREELDVRKYNGEFDSVVYVSPFHEVFWEAANNIFLSTQKNIARGKLNMLVFQTRKELGLYGT